MPQDTGFSNVDGSARADDLVDYLGRLARMLAVYRREDYPQLQLAPGARVLDVGCGAGEVCVELAAQVGAAGSVAGIDPSAAMIEAARQRTATVVPPIDLRVASIYALPFADASFDAVRAERVFQHLEDPNAGLREMIRVTRPGGRVMVIDPDHSQGGLGLDDPDDRQVYQASVRALLAMIVNPCSGTRLRAAFVRAGLVQVSQVVRSFEIDYSDYARATFLAERLDQAIAAREITAAAAARFTSNLAARAAKGEFFANAIGYSVAGTRA
jgi:ubiquinone/menaquinone biosynthesis C-methylase UbiE